MRFSSPGAPYSIHKHLQAIECALDSIRYPSTTYCSDKTMEHVDVIMMLIDKLEGVTYHHPR